MKKILVVGNGAREDALARRLAREGNIVWMSKKNDFSYEFEPNIFYADYEIDDVEAIVHFATVTYKGIFDLVVIGSELPLSLGLTDKLAVFGIPVIGPSQKMARLESSKVFAKDLMKSYNLPTPNFKKFSFYEHDDIAKIKQYITGLTTPFVIKADGLAAGKGVFLEDNKQKALEIIDDLMNKATLGVAGRKILIEEKLTTGYELSFTLAMDGENYIPLLTCKDYKKLLNDDKGPNTGGMGVVAPAILKDSDIYKKIINKIVEPTIKLMKYEGLMFKGFLYIGLFITVDENGIEEPKILEYNTRLGDPEGQTIISALNSSLTDMLFSMHNGSLNKVNVNFSNEHFINVVIANKNYPTKSTEKSKTVSVEKLLLTMQNGVKIFSHGATIENDYVFENGGRVLSIIAHNSDLELAKSIVYTAVDNLKWDTCHYRKDIGAVKTLEKIEVNSDNDVIDEEIILENKTDFENNLDYSTTESSKLILDKRTGKPSFLWIKDNKSYLSKNIDSEINKYRKVHITWCATLKTMEEQNKFEKYNVTSNLSGFFSVNFGDIDNKQVKLHVCKNCINKLDIADNYSDENFDFKNFIKDFKK